MSVGSINKRRLSSRVFSAFGILLLTVALSCNPGSQRRAAAAPQSDELLRLFEATPQEELQPTKWDTGSTIISNESRLELYYDKIKNIGGGYLGVGGTQNFLLAAWANPDWIWLMDFTRRVVAANHIHIAFLKSAETPDQFRKLWNVQSRKEAIKIIEDEYANHPDLAYFKNTWNIGRQYIPWRFSVVDRLVRKRNYKIWLNDQELYQRMRSLAQRGRIKPVRGNLNGSTTVLGIAETARKMRVPVRIIYFSNAEEYMKSYSPEFIKNFSSLPADDSSLVLRTISVQRWFLPWSPDSELSSDKGFHYNMMPVKVFQSWLTQMNRPFNVVDILKVGEINKADGVSFVSKLPEIKKDDPKKQAK